MATITIDDRHYEVDDGQNLLSACLSLKKNLPYFCWHPAMGSVGACRQCAAVEYKDADDIHGKLVMSCMTPVKDGGIYAIETSEAREFRAGIIEYLMTNHPHDCPVCEEGGECHLQDMTLMSGHTLRRYQGLKRTHINQFLGPFINHEMNRCIACYRCVRFYRDYAGGSDLQALGRNHQVYFGRQEDGTLENGFSGNLVEVCPTGVFTDKTYSRHYVRKWDLQTAPSVCEHCAVGCNTAPGARRDGKGDPRQLRRVTNLFHREINGYFLCDRGRYGYEYVNSAARLYRPLSADTQSLIHSTAGDRKIHQPLSPADAVAKLADSIDGARAGRRRLIGIGSPRSSLENNFALQTLVGEAHFYAGLDARNLALLKSIERIQQDPRIFSPGTPDIEQADLVIVLGEDIANTAPRIALALRQTARSAQKRQAQSMDIPLWQDDSVRQLTGHTTPIVLATAERTDLEDIASLSVQCSPKQIAELALALIARLQQPEKSTAEELGSGGDGLNTARLSAARLNAAQLESIAQQLMRARNPLIVSGCGLQSVQLLQASAELAIACAELRRQEPGQEQAQCALYLASPDANSLGLSSLCAEEKHLNQLHHEMQHNAPKQKTTLLILETDLYRQLPTSQAEALLQRADEVIQLELIHTPTSHHADLILPSAATPEQEGTLINSNGLAQRHYAVYEGSGWIQSSWRWLANATAAAAARAGGSEKIGALRPLAEWQHVTQVSAALATQYEHLRPLAELGPDWDQAIDGQKTARQTHRYSGRTALDAEVAVAETAPIPDEDAPMTFSMEGIHFASESPLQANNWAPGWNSNQSIHRYQPKPGAKRLGRSSGQYIARTQHRFVADSNLSEAMLHTETTPHNHTGGFRLVPLYRMFGSGELSNAAATIASVVDQAFALVHPQDLDALNLREGQTVQIRLEGDIWHFQARCATTIARGCIGISCGFDGTAPPPIDYLAPEQITPGNRGGS